MHCAKCGHEHPNNTDFCSHCGACFASEESADKTPKAVTPITKKEYFTNHCSASTKKKRKAIKILSTASLAIQGVLTVLLVISIGVLAYAIKQSPLFESSAPGTFILPIAIVVIFTGASFVFTILGRKKNSTGFFVAATFFSFCSATYGSSIFENITLRQLVALGTLAIYIVIIVLSYQSNKEYKKYISQQKGGPAV